MKLRARLAALSLIAACGGPGAAIAAQDAALPADVAAFIERRQGCDHFRGEGAYDEERRLFLLEQMKATCTGTDAALRDLRRRHARNPAVIAALGEYEWPIEYDTPSEDTADVSDDLTLPTEHGGQGPADAPGSLIVPGLAEQPSIPVTVALQDIDPKGEREVRVLRTNGVLVAVLDSYASKPQGMSRCQAGHEVYFRVVDVAARKERYAKLVDACLGRALWGDPPFEWKSADTITLNLLLEPAITVKLGADGQVTHTP